MSGKKNKDIVYGNVEIPDEEFETRNAKIRVTTFVDFDVVIELKRLAKNSKTKYQTLLNTILRAAVIGDPPKPITEARVRQIAKEVAEDVLHKKIKK